jgi:hypothetical protein
MQPAAAARARCLLGGGGRALRAQQRSIGGRHGTGGALRGLAAVALLHGCEYCG